MTAVRALGGATGTTLLTSGREMPHSLLRTTCPVLEPPWLAATALPRAEAQAIPPSEKTLLHGASLSLGFLSQKMGMITFQRAVVRINLGFT